eukprot:157776-Chlamydomonas_euryale.AAC.6
MECHANPFTPRVSHVARRASSLCSLHLTPGARQLNQGASHQAAAPLKLRAVHVAGARRQHPGPACRRLYGRLPGPSTRPPRSFGTASATPLPAAAPRPLPRRRALVLNAAQE